MNSIIKDNLLRLFNQSYVLLESVTLESILESLISENPEAYDLGRGLMTKLFGEKEICILEESKQNANLCNLFYMAVDRLNSSQNEVDSFKKDILYSLEMIKNNCVNENIGHKIQVIFLEHDFEPNAYFYGYGEADYPILDTPKYIDFNYQQSFFYAIGKIDYSIFWNKKLEFEKLSEEVDLHDLLWTSESYKAFEDAYRYKTSLHLFEAFNQIAIEAFDGLPIKLPLHIFANEHDCEPMNVYLYE